MKRNLFRWLVGLQIGCLALAGCHPTQPFFIGERGELAHYIDRAQQIEYPDLKLESPPESTQSFPPLTFDNQPTEYLDLTLEQCVSYALVNTHVVRTIQGSQRQNFDMASTVLSSPSQQLLTQMDAALTATTTNSQPLAVDQNGNRILPRGSARSNQVGGVEDALSEFDAQFSSFFSYNTTDRPRNVGQGNVFNPQFFQARDSTGQMAISKRMATGGVSTIRSQSIYSFNNIPTQAAGQGNFGRAVPSDYTQIFEAQVQHPLLRGRGTMVNRIPVVLARINEDISIGQFEERIRNLVRDVEFAYWDLYAAYWNVETARIARDSSAQAHRIAFAKKNKLQAGNVEAQTKLTYHNFEAQYKQALAGGNTQGSDPGLFGREQTLRLLMGWAASDGRIIRPIDKPAVALVEFDWYDILGEMHNRNIDLRQQKWLIKQRELELVSSKNQALPDVNVSLLYRWLGVGSSLINNRGGHPPFPTGGGTASAFEELLGGNYQEGAVRLEYTPNAFGSRRQLADIQHSRLQLAREHAVLEDKEIAAVHKLNRVYTEMVSHYFQMIDQLAAMESAQRLVDVWQNKFTMGDAQQDQIVDNLVRATQSRASAGRDFNRALAEYNKSIVDIHAIKGSLLEYNNVKLEEGLWPEKAYWDAHERARERDAATYLAPGASRPKISSRGEYQQDQGTANKQVSPGRSPGGAPKPQMDKSNETPESVPAMPETKQESLPQKAGYQGKPKFEWGT